MDNFVDQWTMGKCEYSSSRNLIPENEHDMETEYGRWQMTEKLIKYYPWNVLNVDGSYKFTIVFPLQSMGRHNKITEGCNLML